jgi:hypothetical protein
MLISILNEWMIFPWIFAFVLHMFDGGPAWQEGHQRVPIPKPVSNMLKLLIPRCFPMRPSV